MLKKILIVDDSATIRQQAKFILTKGGFTVLEGFDGKHGIEMLEANQDIKMIISDINMPNMCGIEMVETIKALGLYDNVPIIMLTTERSVESMGRAKKAGVKGWLVKPFKPDQLVVTVVKMTE